MMNSPRLRVMAAILGLSFVAPIHGQTNPIAGLARLAEEGTPGWEPFNGAMFSSLSDGDKTGVSSQPAAGAADRGAFLSGLEFSEGVIEVDLKGANRPQGSFLGVVFHGVDGKTYDAVYFRPFNFGQSDPVKRRHAVQYMSHPQWPWARLRAERPDHYESRADPEPAPDEWFHAPIELKAGRVRVFVNGSTEPCLDVERLSQSAQGKVGVWFNGTASFANLQIEPAS